jgi:hypothetical protein
LPTETLGLAETKQRLRDLAVGGFGNERRRDPVEQCQFVRSLCNARGLLRELVQLGAEPTPRLRTDARRPHHLGRGEAKRRAQRRDAEALEHGQDRGRHAGGTDGSVECQEGWGPRTLYVDRGGEDRVPSPAHVFGGVEAITCVATEGGPKELSEACSVRAVKQLGIDGDVGRRRSRDARR